MLANERKRMNTHLPHRIQSKLIDFVFGKGARIAYSQEGEDLLLERMLFGQNTGFYVDIGAHHPTRFSNTYRLYQKGWHGLVVDPLPGTRLAFKRHRPRDCCVEVGVSEIEGKLTYHQFNDPALNTFSTEIAAAHIAKGTYRLVEQIEVPTLRLDTILANSLPHLSSIDLMSIDVEGFDLQVLRSNDWQKWRPATLLAECLCSSMTSIFDMSDPVSRFLRDKGYIPVSKLKNTVFFQAVL
jgi:FkbM family methyltransferase